MARKSLKDDLKKRGQAVAEKAQKKAAGKTGGSSSNAGKASVTGTAQAGSRRTVNRAKNGAPSVQNTAKKAVSKVKENPNVQEYQKANQAGQRYLDRRRFTDDMAARSAVRAENIARNRYLPQKPTGILKELGMEKYHEPGRTENNPNTPPGMYKTTLDTAHLDRLVKDESLAQQGYGLNGQPVSYKDIIDASALDPLSALTADSMSYANFGRNKGVKVKEKTDEEKFRDAVEHLKSAARKKGAKQQTLSRHDNKLDQTYRDEIKLAKEDFDAADRQYQAAKARDDTAAMSKYQKERELAHQRAETWRRIKGGFSGGAAGNEYITPELSSEDKANLTKEGQTLLRAAKLGYENAETDEARAMYAAQGQSVRNNPAYQKERFDRGAYRNETGEGRMMYGGTEEERKQEGEQLGAILPAIGTGIAGSFASIPGNVAEALHADAARNQAALQALSDARGGGEVSIQEPEQGPTAQEIMADLLNSERYQNASPLVKARLMKYALQDAKDAIPAGERLLAQSERYRQKATEGQKGLEKYLTEALITGGEMAPGLVATALTGGMAAPGLAVMGAQAAGQEMGTLGMQGVDPVERFNRGVLSGAIEAGTELLPLKNLAKIAKGGGDTFAKNLAAQALEEVGTEELSDILQYGADKAFKDPNASLTAQDLKDTAVISLLTSLGMGTGAGMIGSRRMSPMQRQKTTAAMDQITPTADDLMQQAQDLQRRVSIWHDQGARLQERLANSTQDLTWHKHLLGEMEQHEAERKQLEQELIGLEMQKAQRAEVDRQKAAQEQETARINQAVGEAMQEVTLRDVPTPQSAAQTAPLVNGGQEAVGAPQEAAGLPVANPAAEQVTEPVAPQEAAQGQETPRVTSSQYGQPENHIDNRQSEDLGNRNVKAFQWDHPEIKPFYQKAAQALKEDAEYSDATRQNVRGSKKDQALGRKLGTVMQRNDALNRLHRMGLSTSDIIKACDAIINDQGQENYAAAKRVELALNDMLSKGYIPVEANRNPDAFVGPDAEYLRIKGEISGGVEPGSWEAYRRDHDFIVETGDVTEDELRREWEAEQNQPQSAQEAENTGTVFQSMEDELSALYDRANAMIEEAETGAHDQAYYDEQAQRLLDEERAIRAKWAQENQAEEAFSEDSAQESTPETEEQDAPYSVGAAPGGFDQFSRMANEYGTIEPGENPARIIDVPKSTDGTNRVRKGIRTIMEAQLSSDESIRREERDLVRGMYSYNVKGLEETMDRVYNYLDEKGLDAGYERWQDVVDGRVNANEDDIALGIALWANAERTAARMANQELAAPYHEEAARLAAEIAAEGTKAGRMVNAFRLLKRATPEGKTYYARSIYKKIQSDLNEKYGKKAPKIETNEDLLKAYRDAETEKDRFKALDDIYTDIARQMPRKVGDILNAWRYLAMLGNPRTHIRNVIGNALFGGLEFASGKVSAAVQRAILPKEQRTRAVVSSKAAKEFARRDAEAVENELRGDKYDSDLDAVQRKVQERALIPPFAFLYKKNTALLSWEDFKAKRLVYRQSLASYITAKGWDPNNLTEAQLEQARNHAIHDAKVATFQEENKVASAISKVEQTNSGTKAVVGGLVPFKSVPMNIAKQGFVYSPLGAIKSGRDLARALSDMKNDVQTGKKTAAEAIDGLTKGLTGTSIMAIGILLAAKGMLSSGGTDDDDLDALETAQGGQEYALNIGDYSYTLDWAAPSALPLFMGAEAYNFFKEAFSDSEEEESSGDLNTAEKSVKLLSTALNSAVRFYDPLFNMTVLSGLSGAIGSSAYGNSAAEKTSGVFINALQNYAGQFVPTVLGQVNRTFFDDTRRTTFVDKNKDLDGTWQRFLQRQGNKIPGLSKSNMPYLDVWGRESKQENPLLRALENFASPGYLRKLEDSQVADELKRLNENYDDVLPTKPAAYGKINGEYMTQDQYENRVKTQGNTALDILMDTVRSDSYKNLDDEEKAAFVKKVLDYSYEKGKEAAGSDSVENWVAETDSLAEKSGLGVSALLEAAGVAQSTHNADDNALANYLDFESYMDEKGYDGYQEEVIREAYYQSNEMIRAYGDAVRNGSVSQDLAEQFMSKAKELYPDKDKLTQDQTIATIRALDLSDEEGRAIYDARGWSTDYSKAVKNEAEAQAEQQKTDSIWGDTPQDHIDAFKEAVVTYNGYTSHHKFFKSCEHSGIPKSEWRNAWNEAQSMRSSPWKDSFDTVYYKVYGVYPDF